MSNYDLSKQEIFEKVAKHLFTQGKAAKRGNTCAYRGEGGTSCAVGCLIADEDYKPEMEGASVFGLYQPGGIRTELAAPLVGFLIGHSDLLRALQSAHDFMEDEEEAPDGPEAYVRKKLSLIARLHLLDDNFVIGLKWGQPN